MPTKIWGGHGPPLEPPLVVVLLVVEKTDAVAILSITRIAKVGPLEKDKRSLRLCSKKLPQLEAVS